jgi:predicted DNA-binding transcriptional regulator AlpA
VCFVKPARRRRRIRVKVLVRAKKKSLVTTHPEHRFNFSLHGGNMEFRGMLDVETVSKLMGVCKMTIYRYMKLKDPLPHHKAKGKYFFFPEEVQRWLRER